MNSIPHRTLRSTRILSALAAMCVGLASADSALGQSPQDVITTGLWMGDVTLRFVDNPRSALPEGTPSSTRLRFIVHVDTNGKPRLLKEVILAHQSSPNPDILLFTDPARLVGKPIDRDPASGARAQRIATVAYDFADNDGTPDNALDLLGSFARSQTLRGTLSLPGNHPTNPFRHKYHPDHANTGSNAYVITREIEFKFSNQMLDINGTLQAQAEYKETIRGLHRAPLSTYGSITLTRITTVGSLNP